MLDSWEGKGRSQELNRKNVEWIRERERESTSWRERERKHRERECGRERERGAREREWEHERMEKRECRREGSHDRAGFSRKKLREKWTREGVSRVEQEIIFWPWPKGKSLSAPNITHTIFFLLVHPWRERMKVEHDQY